MMKIAELNAPGIYSCDLNTSDNIGAVTQNIDIHYTNTEFNVKDEYINKIFKMIIWII